MDDTLNSENIHQVYSQLQEVAEQLRKAGARLPDNFESLLQGMSFPADIPFDRMQKSSASVTPLEPAVHAEPSWISSLEHILAQGAVTIGDQFTVDPSDKGGQAAGKGFEFQDLYTIFLMTKFLDEDAPAVLMRIEGAEDVDLLTRHGNNMCEWYYQIKTIREGKNWTLQTFDTEGVWWRFACCVSQFFSKCSNPNRSIQVALIVDGDMSEDIQTLRDTPKTFSIREHLDDTVLADQPLMTRVRAEALFSVARQYLLLHYSDKDVRNALRSRTSSCAKRLEKLCSALIPILDSGLLKTIPQLSGEVSASVTELAEHLVQTALQSDDLSVLTTELTHDLELLSPSSDYLEALQACLIKAYRLLDPLFVSLQIESRIGFAVRSDLLPPSQTRAQTEGEFAAGSHTVSSAQPAWHSYLKEGILLQLVERTYLSSSQTRIVYGQLKGFVRQAAQTGRLVDRSLFDMLITSVPRIQLEEIPDIDHLVHRSDLVDKVIQNLNTQPVVYLYGFSKIGKTSLAAMVARKLSNIYTVFWHTIGSGANCIDRLFSDFTYFIGELTGSRNLYTDWYERRHSPNTIIEALATCLTGCSILIVLDNCHVLDNGQVRVVSDLLRALTSTPGTNTKVLMVGEVRTGLPSFVSVDTAMRTHGLSFKESIELLRVNGCSVTQNNMLGFLLLHSKVDGHPLMLQIAAQQLGRVSSAEAVSELTVNLPDLNQDTIQFFDRLAHQIFSILETPEQKETLRRLSVLPFGFDIDLCFALARCKPPLDFKVSDWRRLAACVFDRSHRDKYVVPELFKQIAAEDISPDLKRMLYEIAANHIIERAQRERRVDFWDFQEAILYYGLAGRWQDAAMYFLGSLNANPDAPYEQLDLLYTIFRGPAFQSSDVDPAWRSAIAFSEFRQVLANISLGGLPSRGLDILKRARSAVLAIEDDQARTIQLCLYHLLTSSLYDRLLVSAVTQNTTSSSPRAETALLTNCSNRSLRRARKAFRYATLSREFGLLQTSFKVIMHANYLAAVPSLEEIPLFLDTALENQYDLIGINWKTKWGKLDLWNALSNTYQSYAINASDPSTVLATLEEHLAFASDRELIHLEVVIRHAIAYWRFERAEEYESAFEMCTNNLALAEQLDDSIGLQKEIRTLRADSAYALRDYASACIDYTQAAQFSSRTTPLIPLDVIIQTKIGDCHWHLGEYRLAAAAYLKALRMRSRVREYDHSRSFQLFGRLSLTYLCMGCYWNAIQIHEKMLSIYERFQDDTMFVRMGGSLQEALVAVPNSNLGGLYETCQGEFARPKQMGPRFYDAPIMTNGLQAWLDRTSKASFRYLLAQAYDAVGDIGSAILQANAALQDDHRSNYIPIPVLHSLIHELLSELHLKTDDKFASAHAAFDAIALTEDFLASNLSSHVPQEEILTDEHLVQQRRVRETLRNAVPWEYAQTMFRHLVERTILEEINKKCDFGKQARYFLNLVDLAAKLPPSISPCIEAWVQLYSGIFYLTRGYRRESTIAFERMNELVLAHDLPSVELAYWLHTTFGLATLLYPSAESFIGACVKTAIELMAKLPDFQHLLVEYNKRLVEIWLSRLTILSAEQLTEAKNNAVRRLRRWSESIADPEELFFHICATLLLIVQNNDLWSDEARILQQETLARELEHLDADEIFELYDEFGSFGRGMAQHHILKGNVAEGQDLARTLRNTMSFAIENYRGKLSPGQLDKLQEHQKVAALWTV